MTKLTTRQQYLDFLVEVEINPNEILSHDIADNWIKEQLNSMLITYRSDDEYSRDDFNNDLMVLDRIIRTKFD